MRQQRQRLALWMTCQVGANAPQKSTHSERITRWVAGEYGRAQHKSPHIARYLMRCARAGNRGFRWHHPCTTARCMTGDQRLVVKLEDVLEKLDSNELLAAFHVLDEVVKELESLS